MLIAGCYLANIQGKQEVDHIDGNRQNNDVSNLRWVSREENSYNRAVNKGKTVPKGISWDKNLSKWRARIWHHKREVHLGYFDNLEEAMDVRHKKETELRAEFMRK